MSGRTSDGTRYLVEGSGEPIVLVHGVGLDLTMWDRVATRLKREHCVIRYDMLGHGESAKPNGPYTLAGFVRQLKGLTSELTLEKVVLVGFSMGGLVAQGFALDHRHVLSRLVLLNTVYNRNRAEREAIAQRVEDLKNGGLRASIEAAIERWFTPEYRANNVAVVDAVRHRMLTNERDAYIAAYEVFATSDAELAPRVNQIRCPTRIITGEGDQRSTAEMARALAAQIARASVEVVPGQRHLIPLELPEIVAGEIMHQASA